MRFGREQNWAALVLAALGQYTAWGVALATEGGPTGAWGGILGQAAAGERPAVGACAKATGHGAGVMQGAIKHLEHVMRPRQTVAKGRIGALPALSGLGYSVLPRIFGSEHMNRQVVITCAVTGAGDTVGRHPAIPVTPAEIAAAALDAAKAGAAVVHCHVRDPATGKGSRDVALYREVVARIRESDTDVVVNLTAGMGGDLFIGPDERPREFGADTDLVGALERLPHVEELLPEICSLDCGSYNFGEGSLVYVSTPDMLRRGAKRIQELGVKPELEVFDTGHLWFARQMLEEGLLDEPPLFQLCHGIRWGAPPELAVLQAWVQLLPPGANWTAFAISRDQMPFAAAAALLGGNVRVGLEDNLYLERGVHASNAQLVERARSILELMGAEVVGPAAAREKFGLTKRA